MTTLFSLLWLLFFLGAGFFLAKWDILSWSAVFSRIFSLMLFLLLLSMGLRLGQSRDVLESLPLIGSLSLVSSILASAGTVLVQLIMFPLYRALEGGSDPKVSKKPVIEPDKNIRKALYTLFFNLRQPLFLLFLVLVGTIVGFFLPTIPLLRDGSLATWILYGLLFCIGIQMASSGPSLRKSLANPSILLIPLATVVGTLAASLFLIPLYGLPLGKALAVGGGFGWYSLSGVLIADLGEPLLGAASFLSNLIRESLAFICIPLLRFTGRYETGVGIAGATSMDVTLPVLEGIWGPACVPPAVVHGVILSFLVPFLIPFFMSF